MVARIWHGKTKTEHYDEYSRFMRDRAIPDYSQTEGFIRLDFLRRLDGDVAYFQLITYWENHDVIKAFAGDQPGLAKYYPEDDEYLLEFEEYVTHYDVFATA